MDKLDVGGRVKYLRELYGFSQRELAKRSGLTHGTISMIERNKISPAVGSLRQILDSFSITLSEFFSLEQQSQAKFFYNQNELLQVGTGGVSLLQVGEDLTGRPLQLLLERYAPGDETAKEPYSHPGGEEGGIVVEGQIELTVGGQTRLLKKHDGYLFPSRLPHRFRNPGPGECVIVSANTPPV